VLRWCPSARSLSFRVQGRRLACGDYENLLVECPGGRKPAGYREVPTTQVGSGAVGGHPGRPVPRTGKATLFDSSLPVTTRVSVVLLMSFMRTNQSPLKPRQFAADNS
jgi:hypothetical protein